MMLVFVITALVAFASIEYAPVSAKHCTGECLRAAKPGDLPLMKTSGTMQKKNQFWAEMKESNKMSMAKSTSSANCVDGFAGEYPCSGLDLQYMVSLKDLGCDGDGSDIWGWTDAENNEYALATCEDGTSMVDITDPKNPVILGLLPTNTGTSYWFDVKVYKNFAYVGSEAYNHGMSVFDLTQLTALSNEYRASKAFTSRDLTVNTHVNLDNVFSPNFVYEEFSTSHNMVINEQSGYLYAVGTDTCDGGLHILDLNADPANPTFVGCFADDGYTHDAECVVYTGPDSRYTGHEICFNFNEDTLTIVDVSDKDSMVILSRQGYDLSGYTHQGSLNPAMSQLMMNDETDEYYGLVSHTRSIIWDVQQLDAPFVISEFFSDQKAIDHNEYIHKGVSWQSNYCAGLRVLDARTLETGHTKELAYFDVAPSCDEAEWLGAWSSYPYYKSGTVAVQSIDKGLFLLKPIYSFFLPM